jgi:hypothetical protein
MGNSWRLLSDKEAGSSVAGLGGLFTRHSLISFYSLRKPDGRADAVEERHQGVIVF